MQDLIEALQILLKYANPDSPTSCEHGVLYFNPEFEPGKVSEADKHELLMRGIEIEESTKSFYSYRYGE